MNNVFHNHKALGTLKKLKQTNNQFIRGYIALWFTNNIRSISNAPNVQKFNKYLILEIQVVIQLLAPFEILIEFATKMDIVFPIV